MRQEGDLRLASRGDGGWSGLSISATGALAGMAEMAGEPAPPARERLSGNDRAEKPTEPSPGFAALATLSRERERVMERPLRRCSPALAGRSSKGWMSSIRSRVRPSREQRAEDADPIVRGTLSGTGPYGMGWRQ